MPWAFLVVLAAIAAITASAVIGGTDFDGSKTFISTAADQRSMVAFAANATVIAGLFGAIAAAREYANGTVIPTFLSYPGVHRAVLAQLAAIAIGGAVIGLVGAALTVARRRRRPPHHRVRLPDLRRRCRTGPGGRGLRRRCRRVLGAGIGTIVRNTGGAVTGAVLALIVAPPLIVQLVNDASSWVPSPWPRPSPGSTRKPPASSRRPAWSPPSRSRCGLRARTGRSPDSGARDVV